jgi:hypothetical protein
MTKPNKLLTLRGNPKMRAQVSLITLVFFFITILSGCDLNEDKSRVAPPDVVVPQLPVPAIPENLKAVALVDGVELSWSSVEYAEKYKLFRCPVNLDATISSEICGTQAVEACNQDPIETMNSSILSTIDQSVDLAGSYCYLIEACNNDETCSAQSEAVVGYAQRNILTVVASGPQFTKESHTVSLSANVEGTEGDISYAWSQTSAGTKITLTGADTISPFFTAPVVNSPENLTFNVEVNRGGQVATDTIIVTVQPDNIAVNAGADKSVSNGDTVSLHAIGSGDGTGSEYVWKQTEGTTVTLSNSNTANPRFTAPSPASREELEFEVSFSDGLKTASNKVIITVQGTPKDLLSHSPFAVPVAGHRAPLIVSVPGSFNAFSGGIFTIPALAAGGDEHYSWEWKWTKKSPSSVPDPILTNTDHAILTVDLSSVTAPVQYSFNVTVTDNEGSSHTETSELIVNIGSAITFNPLVADASSIIVNENFPGVLSVLASGGTPPYQYKWQQLDAAPSPQVTLTGADTEQAIFTGPNVDGDITLSFEVEVTDADGITFTKNLNALIHDVFSYAPPQVLRLQPMPSISVLSGQSSQLTVGVTGGDSNYSWEWSQISGSTAILSDQTTAVLAVTMPTISVTETLAFNVKVTDGSGGTAEEIVYVELISSPKNAALELITIPSLHVNEGEIAQVIAQATGGSGQYSYQWSVISGIDGQALSNTDRNVVTINVPLVSAETPVTLNVEISDNDTGEIKNETVSLVINDNSGKPLQIIQLQPMPPISILSGQSSQLAVGVTGGDSNYNWEWSQVSGSPAVLSGQTSAVLALTMPTISGTEILAFNVKVTDGSGNTAEETVDVELISSPKNAALELLTIPSLHVNEGEIAQVPVQATGGSGQYSYQWSVISGIDGQLLSNTDQSMLTLNVPAVTAKQLVTLEVTATDTVSGLSITESVTVIINDISSTLQLFSLHDIRVTSGDFVTLHGGDAGGGKKPYTYTWLQTGGTPSVTLNNASSRNADFTATTVTAKTIFTFEMTVTDDIGNTTKVTEHVTVAPPLPPLTATLNGADNGQSGTKMSLTALAGGGTKPYTYNYTTSGVQFKIDATDNPTFTVPAVAQDTTATVTLMVHDSSTPKQQQTSSEHKITIKPVKPAVDNPNPEAIAPVTAELCSGQLCGIFGYTNPISQCPPDKPYAMNSLELDGGGGADVTKLCASFQQCNQDWWESTSDVGVCTQLIPQNSSEDIQFPYGDAFIRNCSYCCTGNDCNVPTIPVRNSLFKGHQ